MRIAPALLTQWTAPAMHPQPPSTASEISSAFQTLGATATADVISLYEQFGGMDIPDGEWWRLWPLPELLSGNSKREGGPIAFSDYLMCCWCFYLEPVNAEVSRVLTNYGEGPLIQIAPSLQAFITELATSPLRVLDPKARR